MGRGVLHDVGGAHEGNRLLHGHVLRDDIAGPDVADVLLPLQVVLRDLFHGDGHVLKVSDALPEGGAALAGGVDDDEGKYPRDQQEIDQDDPVFSHVSSPRLIFGRSGGPSAQVFPSACLRRTAAPEDGVRVISASSHFPASGWTPWRPWSSASAARPRSARPA